MNDEPESAASVGSGERRGYFWLIEWPGKGWLSCKSDSNDHVWTHHAEEGISFTDQESAKAGMKMLHCGMSALVAEHQWMPPDSEIPTYSSVKYVEQNSTPAAPAVDYRKALERLYFASVHPYNDSAWEHAMKDTATLLAAQAPKDGHE